MESLIQNPNLIERRKQIRELLEQEGRMTDYIYLLQTLCLPPDITTFAPLGIGKGRKVGIIGGGCAGLVAGFELRKLGFDITIIEANDKRLGGRIYTHYFDENKRYLGELGAMRIPVSHEIVWHYIDLFGLETTPFIQTTPADLFYIRMRHACNDEKSLSVMENIYPAFNLRPNEQKTPWRKLMNNAINSVFSTIPPSIRPEIVEIMRDYHPKITEIDKINIRTIFENANLSKEAISMLSNLSPFIGDYFYSSAIELFAEIYTLDFTRLYRLKNGMVELPLAFFKSFFASDLEKYYPQIKKNQLGNINWLSGYYVEKITQPVLGGKVKLHYKDHNQNSFASSFDYVICTIPFSTLRHVEVNPLFSSEKMQAIQEFNYENSYKAAFFFKERFWERSDIVCGPKLGGSAASDRPITTVWYPSDHFEYLKQKETPPKEPGVLLATYNFTLDADRLGNLPKERRHYEIKKQLEQIHNLPKNTINQIMLNCTDVNWNLEEWSLGAFGYYYPGQKTLFSWIMAQPEYQNRIFFAGEHISGKHAWLQGSFKTAIQAANEIAKEVAKEEFN